MSEIIYLRFMRPVSVGGNEVEYWARPKPGSVSQEWMHKVTVVDNAELGVTLKFRANGDADMDVDVPRGNLAQVTRKPLAQGIPEPEGPPEPVAENHAPPAGIPVQVRRPRQ